MKYANFVFVDTRPDWMKKEDQQVACYTRCEMFSKCISRCGSTCQRMGGELIPRFKQRVNPYKNKRRAV